MNSTLMTCTMPEVQLPSDYEVNDQYMSVTSGGDVVAMRGADDDGRSVSVSVGLQFDGYHINLSAMHYVMFHFFPQPTFDIPTDVIVYRPDSFSHIDIKVGLGC